MFHCDAWEARRRDVTVIVGSNLTPVNMVQHMLESAEKWRAIADYIHSAMKWKEEEERKRQRI